MSEALAVSEAMAALVAKVPHASQDLAISIPTTPADSAAGIPADLLASAASDDSWLTHSGCASAALTAAQEALSKEVDDPEELVHALTLLEQERAYSTQFSGDGIDKPGSARQAVESELRIRISALRIDAAAMLDDMLVVGDVTTDACGGDAIAVELEEDGLAVHGTSAAPAYSDAASDVATALEVATTLGVDTEPSEQRIACKRGMLSLRVVWGKVARFCMLPVNVGFASLVVEVTRRFGLSLGVPLPQLCWREAGEKFKLNSQASWEECLQRRGLVAQPGRLELCIDSEDPPPLPVSLRGPVRRPLTVTSRPELFTWHVPPSSRRTGRREFCAHSPTGGRESGVTQREFMATSPLGNVDASVAGTDDPRGRLNATDSAVSIADDSRKRLHAAAAKVQRLFRVYNMVRKQAQDDPADADGDDPAHRTTGHVRPKCFTSTYSRGFGTEQRRNASDAPSQHLGQTIESLSAEMQQRQWRSTSRRRGFGVDARDKRSLSPKAKSPPYQARRMFDSGTGSRLQATSRCAPRR